MAQIDGARQQDTNNEDAEALGSCATTGDPAGPAARQQWRPVSLELPIRPSDKSEILHFRQALTEKRRVPCHSAYDAGFAIGKTKENRHQVLAHAQSPD